MQFVADLHLHSKYSRAVSKDMVLPIMAEWAKKKGIDILATGDWTHPLWLREIRNQLEEKSKGLFKLKSEYLNPKSETNSNSQNHNVQKQPLFLLSVEVSSIYSQGGRVRRIHNLIFVPSFETAEKINKELVQKGCNLMSDGRPIIGISSIQLLELVLSIDKASLLIPCHAWTPWFSLYGSNSGFDSIDECFGDYAKYIYAIETGLSSDPLMNWGIKELENRSILSFSDAHSPMKMGREATVFELSEPTYENIRNAIIRAQKTQKTQITRISDSQKIRESDASDNPKLRPSEFSEYSDNRIVYTLEFYPEEGKYHYTGHRNCRIVQTPQETKEKGVICPVCKRPLTVGVEHRVQELANRNSEFRVQNSELDEHGVRWIKDPTEKHPPYIKLVPLIEIIAESLQVTPISIKAKTLFDELCIKFGSEINVLLKTEISEIARVAGERVSEGIQKVRTGDIVVEPGFDGEYGKVKIWSEDSEEDSVIKVEKTTEQMGLF